MRYLCLLSKGADTAVPEPGTPEFTATMDAFETANRAMADAGVLIELGRLQSESTATTVRASGEETVLTDGPFAELKEEICGFYLLDCADLDQALRWAATIPLVRSGGAVEVRPLMAMEGPATTQR
ncbi:YciI family protein [Streptomyces carpinensis]|uniref:YciI family protein n=1 Tax=Streptomyces carpinensis TaxID=66369 RepID=A0ABV1WIF7_9ACTN|nr:YciI family protein [Streptomyces carpinensis]